MAILPKLDFISIAHDERIPPGLKNTFVIRNDNWNDFGSYVRFDLFWFNENGARSTIGKTKILHGTEEKAAWIVDSFTTPPRHFSADIGSDFISLGQSDAYYAWMHETFGDDTQKVLTALRDIAVMPGLAGRFEPSTVFRNGMMRENAAWRSRRFGSAWSLGEEPIEKPSFSYACQLSDDEQPFLIEFDFRAHDILPRRVVGIIGRNAVGKTRFLAQLGADLAQVRRVSAATVEERKRRFPGDQPLFTRILAVSYSAFDRFSRPSTHAESSYIYCGIRDENGNLSQTGLQRTFRSNKARVRRLDRREDWIRHIAKILGETSELGEADLQREIDSDLADSEMLGWLSSGQAILCHFVTGLLAWLQPESLVLFDEPETHLHPNAVANLFVVLTEILRDHRSYAVVATHSPIVIQEIPSKRVMVFTREEGVTYANPLKFESFGESVAELTEHVFKTQEAESLYREVLDRIARNMTLEEALDLFTNRLSMNAKSYLVARYARDAEK
ncbi:AAA family ATPase [Rhizobium sp. CC1099]|uniref:AAA family ATPase n=1 Tax=Rhizobium sp. CC1099 TaxID=3039160 RepID=UPI0024B0A4A9|nr:AAA family ATPase [Rhizobium sp. CC1099]WFU88751.1 AAA family ATPase [Rhizobium sp. CC1099]